MMEDVLMNDDNCDYKSMNENKKDKLAELEKIRRNFKLTWFQMLYYLKGMYSFDNLPQVYKDLNSFIYLTQIMSGI